jgi:MYXO-CTERM domain-containing protein
MRRTPSILGSALLVATALTVARSAEATKYQVGPSRAQKTLQDVQTMLKPGDVVELDGDATYPGGVFFKAAQSGSAAQKVTIRGMKVNGKRPVISGGGSGNVQGLGMVLNGSHYVLESIEVTGSTNTCIVHKGDDITIRDFVVHDCPGQGLLGHDFEAGSLTLEQSEFYACGSGMLNHQIYMATGEMMYPGAVFRMQHCYVHDGKGGNNVKSRSQRNEIYYNWIESAFYHDLELIGPDSTTQTPEREDGDVVGNVLVGNGSQKFHLVRIGGDKAGAETGGRYRFVNNTFVVGTAGNASIVRLMLKVDTLEMHNNAFIRMGAGTAPFFALSDVNWVNGVSLFGSNNWVQDGFTGAPATWTGTLTGADPGLTDVAMLDLRVKADSALVDKGAMTPASPAGREFPNPLGLATFVPPARQISVTPSPRAAVGALDIGAFEFGSGSAAPPPGTNPGPGGTSASGGSAGTSGGADADAGDGAGAGNGDSGCGCRVVAAPSLGAFAALAGLGALVGVLRRRNRRSRPKS